MMKRKQLLLTASVSLLLLINTAAAQTTAFTYQGKLTDSGNLANGNYDLQVKLFDALSAGTQLGATQTVSPVPVSNGIFTVNLDFGVCAACFNGANRFLEIAVRPTGGGSFTTLSPRQPITSTPYALKSQTASSADSLSLSCFNCVTSSQIGSVNGSVVSGTIPVASVPAGSANYIQNGTSPQASSNFNISGTGTADILNVTTRYNINGLHVLSTAGSNNLFAGFNAGLSISVGNNNAFFGSQAGQANSTGNQNAFFGNAAGISNTGGSQNAFFGLSAGGSNTTGSNNAFFGFQAGLSNNGIENAFFGSQAGLSNTDGISNVFLGSQAGFSNSTGSSNTFIGKHADFNTPNPSGNNNTLLGAFTGVSSGSSNATAIGAFAQVSQSNSLVLGNNANVGIGTSAPQFKLDVVGDINTTTQYNLGGLRVLSVAGEAGLNNLFAGINAGTSGSNDAFFGTSAGQANTSGSGNAFFGTFAGKANTIGGGNSFFGFQAGNANTTGNQNAFFGSQAGIFNITGSNNAFFGEEAGRVNTSGNFNAFFGNHAGDQNVNGSSNAFFGSLAGVANAGGSSNTFIGTSADFNASNPVGSNNTLLGANARVFTNFNNATAIGSRAQVEQGNSLVLGSINLVNGATADTKVGIGTTTPDALLDVERDNGSFPETVRFTTYGTDNKVLGRASSGSRSAPTATPSGRDLLQLGGTGHDGTNFVSSPKATIVLEAAEAWTSTAQGTRIRFHTTTNGTTTISSSTPRMTIEDDGNVGIGTAAPAERLHVAGNTVITGNIGIGTTAPATKLHVSGTGTIRARVDSDSNAGLAFTLSNAPKWSVATVTGDDLLITNDALGSNAVVINSANNNVGIGTSNPQARLHVNGLLRVATLGTGGSTLLCQNASDLIATCSSSLRYKTAIQPFVSGLEIVKRLRPITFTWKQGGMRDLGFAAEEVAQVEPLFTFTNAKGEVEGVKYDRLSLIFVNAIKEQQKQLEHYQNQLADEQQRRARDESRLAAQQQQLSQQQHEIDTLKRLVCLDHPKAKLCKASQ